jgi:phenylacetate-CoA ligase
MSRKAPLSMRLADGLRGTYALRMYRDFLRSQWFSPERLRAMQWNGLKELIEHAYDTTPYYRHVFESLGAEPSDIRSLEDFRRIPILKKHDVREHSDELLSARPTGRLHKKRTGGSSGEPLTFFLDGRSHSALWAYIYRSWTVGGWKPGDRVITLGGRSVSPSLGRLAHSVYFKLNHFIHLPVFDLSEQNMARWASVIQSSRAHFMYAYASSAYLFARYCEEQQISGVRFRSVFTTSEVLHEEYRHTIERAFQCEVFDMYGGSDGAGYAFECREHAGLHLVAENALVELIDDTGKEVECGGTGDVITTDLFNFSMPFIRYEVGDRAIKGDCLCKCGRGLPRVKEVVGRSNDYVLSKSGEKVASSFFSFLLRDFEWIERFYVVQQSPELVVVHLKPAYGQRPRGLPRIESIIQRRLPGMKVDVVIVEEIPLLPSGKHKYVVNNTVA